MRAPIALLTFAAAALIAVPGTSFAQVAPRPQVGVRTEVYVDDDGTTIWRPRASVGVPVGGDYAVNATYLADVVSSASIDVVTRASKPIGELHQEATLAVSRALPREGSVAVGYGFVHEPDFLGNAISFVGGVDLGANREYHVSTRLVGGISRVGTVVDPQFEEHIYSCLATAGLSRIVNARLVMRGNLELQNLYGFLGSPYRTVRIGDWSGMPYTGTDPDALAWVFTGVTATARENVPDERFRSKISMDLVAELGHGFALYGNFGMYADSWSILATDDTLELRFEPRPNLLFRLGGRVYAQSPAYFWRMRYDTANGVDGFVTDDKKLGPMQSYSGIAAGSIPLGSQFHVDFRVEFTHYHFPEFTLLHDRRALATQLGVVWRP